MLNPFEDYLEFSVLVAHEGHQKWKGFTRFRKSRTFYPFISDLNVANVDVQIVDFQLGRIHELGQGFSFYFPVDELSKAHCQDQRTEDESNLVVLVVKCVH